jgi:hypothetical protein
VGEDEAQQEVADEEPIMPTYTPLGFSPIWRPTMATHGLAKSTGEYHSAPMIQMMTAQTAMAMKFTCM